MTNEKYGLEYWQAVKAERDRLREQVKTLDSLCAERFDEIAVLQGKVKTLRAALEPFSNFAEKFSQKPLRGVSNTIYGIHAGTKWEAEITHDDCRNARAALESTKD